MRSLRMLKILENHIFYKFKKWVYKIAEKNRDFLNHRFRCNLCVVHSETNRHTDGCDPIYYYATSADGSGKAAALCELQLINIVNTMHFVQRVNSESVGCQLYTMSVARPTSSFAAAAAAAAAASKLYIVVALLLVMHVNAEQTSNTRHRRSPVLDDGKGETHAIHSSPYFTYLFRTQRTTQCLRISGIPIR